MKEGKKMAEFQSFFSTICDEASDITKIDQLSFLLYWCSAIYASKEDFIDRVTASTLRPP